MTQPWATAICIGLKRWETRSWSTSLRGQICIHAAKGFPGWANEFALEQAETHGLQGLIPSFLPLGKIVCVADLVECCQTETVRSELDDCELSFGDFADGRYCFRFANVIPLASPISVSGALGFWRVGMDAATEVIRQIKAAGRFSASRQAGSS